MSIVRKGRLALSVLVDDGFGEFAKRLTRNLRGMASGQRQPDEGEAVFNAIEAGLIRGVMIDVGAHFGAELDRYAVAGWRVVACEPDSKNRRKLDDLYGDAGNVSIDPRAVSDVAEQGRPFFRSDTSSGISSLSNFEAGHTEAEKIDITTLAALFEEYQIAEVDVLKIDAEGFDLMVLRSLPASLVPAAVVCEFEDRKTMALGYTHTALGNALAELGLTVLVSEWYPIKAYGSVHEWRALKRWPATLEEEASWGNMLAFRDPAVADRAAAYFRRFERGGSSD